MRVLFGHFSQPSPYIWLVFGSVRIKKQHHEDACLKEIGLSLQILLSTPHSIATRFEGPSMHSIKDSTNMHFQ